MGHVDVLPAVFEMHVLWEEFVVEILVAALAADNQVDWDCLHSHVDFVFRSEEVLDVGE